MRTLSFILLIFCLSNSVLAQQYLYIKKKGEIPSERLGENSRVKIKLQGQDEWIGGLMTEINKNAIKINDRLFYFSNIESVRIYNPWIKSIGTTMWVGGAMFSGIALFNRFINDDQPLLTNGQIIFGTSMVGSSFIVTRLSRKTYSKSDGYKFEVIDLDNFDSKE